MDSQLIETLVYGFLLWLGLVFTGFRDVVKVKHHLCL